MDTLKIGLLLLAVLVGAPVFTQETTQEPQNSEIVSTDDLSNEDVIGMRVKIRDPKSNRKFKVFIKDLEGLTKLREEGFEILKVRLVRKGSFIGRIIERVVVEFLVELAKGVFSNDSNSGSDPPSTEGSQTGE